MAISLMACFYLDDARYVTSQKRITLCSVVSTIRYPSSYLTVNHPLGNLGIPWLGGNWKTGDHETRFWGAYRLQPFTDGDFHS